MNDEELLKRLGSLPDEIRPPERVWSQIEDALPDEGATVRRARIYVLRAVAVAAAVVGLVTLAWFLTPTQSGPDGWLLQAVDAARPVASAFKPGDTIETDSTTRYVASTDIGQVVVNHNTHVGLREHGEDRQVLALTRGEIYARIDAPPRVFVVETPTVTAIDLGCEYRLAVDDAGRGSLEVVSGWVALAFGGREWFVPAGAAAVINGEDGPAAPVFYDASVQFKEAVSRLPRGTGSPFLGANPDDVQTILDEARFFDSLTLWHLAFDATREERALLFDAMDRVGAVPNDFAAADFIAQRPAAMDWLRIHLEESVWFRPELFFGTTAEEAFGLETSIDSILASSSIKKKRKPAWPGRIAK